MMLMVLTSMFYDSVLTLFNHGLRNRLS